MCGIAGVLYFGRREGPMDGVGRMSDAMRARGPDDEGFAFFDAAGGPPRILGGPDTPESALRSDHAYCPRERIAAGARTGRTAKLGLGHRRLSIIDLSPGGHQPMSTPDGRYWLVYNGEIYNFAEIREDLAATSGPFRTSCDSEVLLRAYAEYGPRCLERFNGMFAFAIWDREERTLFCARDRIGIKPFYYYRGDGYLVFASELPALVDSGLYPPEVNEEGLYHGMSLLIAPRPITAFRGVYALEPAHWMVVTDEGSIKRERYWAVPTGPVDAQRSPESCIEELDSLVDRAVRRRLIADVEVGTFMSGGVDSTLVSALAAKHQPGIKAFTLSSRLQPEIDELPQARATAAMWPMTHVVRETASDYRIALERALTRVYIEPFSGLSPNFIVSRLAAESSVVAVLNGTGPDEIFAGYRRFDTLPRWRRLQQLGALPQLLPAVGPLARLGDLARCDTIADHFLHAFGLFGTAHKRSLLHPDFLAEVDEPETARVLDRLYMDSAGEFVDDVQASCYLELVHYVGNHFTNRMDPIMMHFSLEGRFPFLDHEVVEFAMRLPSRFKIRDGERKWALRRVAARYIHPSCLEMKKKGFGLPLQKWVEGPLRGFIREKLTALAETGIFRAEAVLAMRDGTIRPRPNPRQLWYLVSTQLWLETFFGAGRTATTAR